jgi:hypothetical protein
MSPYLIYLLEGKRGKAVAAWHEKHLELMKISRGSAYNHQTWIGGYLDHIGETMRIAVNMFDSLQEIRKLPFALDSALIVLYFHDVEKIWKYTHGHSIDKREFYEKLGEEEILFSPEEWNALEYVHGEHDYSGQVRKMGELAAFCHACDVLSARMWHDKGQGLGLN